MAYQRVERNEEAIDMLKAALGQDATMVDGYQALIGLLQTAGRMEEAQAWARRAPAPPGL